MDSEITPPGCGSRHGQVLLMFLGLVCTYCLRVNLSVAIVAMTDNSSNSNFPELDWDSAKKGTILSSFFWGYMVMQIPAGVLARRHGPSYLLAGSLIFCGLLTVLTPVAALRGGWIVVTGTRVLQGLGQGFIFPSLNTHLAKWMVPQERAKLYSFVLGGAQLASIIMMSVGGLLATSPGGWPSIFYVSGGAAILWGVICAYSGADSPDKHRKITFKEKEYIQRCLTHSSEKSHELSTPWRAIATSIPFIAMICSHMAQNWGFWTLLTQMPTYIAKVLHFDIKSNGFLSALPYVTSWILTWIFSFVADYINRKNLLSSNFSRKMWNSIALYGSAIALVCLAFTRNVTGAVVLLVFSVSLNSGCNLGYLCNHLDLSPNFAGTLVGITNCVANVTSIIAPIIAGYITTDESNPVQWQTVFLISAGIYFIGNTIFIIFGSTEVQPWNNPQEKS